MAESLLAKLVRNFPENGPKDAVRCRIERAHIRHWLRESHPVVLALYDARADMAYWLLVKDYFEQIEGFDLARCGERIGVLIPRRHVLDRKAMKTLARWTNEIETGLQRS